MVPLTLFLVEGEAGLEPAISWVKAKRVTDYATPLLFFCVRALGRYNPTLFLPVPETIVHPCLRLALVATLFLVSSCRLHPDLHPVPIGGLDPARVGPPSIPVPAEPLPVRSPVVSPRRDHPAALAGATMLRPGSDVRIVLHGALALASDAPAPLPAKASQPACAPRPEGYRGPDLAPGSSLRSHRIKKGETWSHFSIRHHLSYRELALLNSRILSRVLAGKDLIAGRAVFVLRGPLRKCAS